nr:immunoglobulin heavy chain junction region [Mus musculus]
CAKMGITTVVGAYW